MLDLNDFRLFVRIVECNGLTAAGRSLNLPKSTLSYRLQQLEAGLGTRLINRTSRSLGLTDPGKLFYQHALLMLEEAEKAENAVREQLAQPSGTIRLTTAVATSLFVLRHLLPEFLRRYPSISVVQHTSDDNVDIVGGGYDVAIRAHAGPLSDSALVQRQLAKAPWSLFASPGYLAAQGEPADPADLPAHQGLLVQFPGVPPAWKLSHGDGRDVAMPARPRIASNDLMLLRQAALEHLGITVLPAYICRQDVLEGRLLRVLPGWSAGEAAITAVIPFRHGLLPSVRAFVDFLRAEVPKLTTI